MTIEIDPERLPGDARHGYTDTPRSRAFWCASTPGSNCGDGITYEPQSVEAPKGWPKQIGPNGKPTPRDGELASGNHHRFRQIDGVRTPNGHEWPATLVRPGGVLRFRWWLTAVHKTAKWEYWITRDDWNPELPLSRAQFEPEPFTVMHWPCPGAGNTCHMPIRDTHHFAYLPRKTGRHVIYAIWEVGDTDQAFYQAIDVKFSAATASHVAVEPGELEEEAEDLPA